MSEKQTDKLNTDGIGAQDAANPQNFPQDVTSLPVMHVYAHEGGLLFIPQENLVENLVQKQDEAAISADNPHISDKETQPLAAKTPLVQKHSYTGLIAPGVALFINIAIVLAIFFMDILPVLTQQATITIIPKSATFTTQLTLSNIQSRVFTPLTLSQTKTVGTTGHGHQDATHASGFITFYNAAPYPQTIHAGELLTGADGIAIVTEEDAVIPAGNFSGNGEITIAAHAVNKGAGGNIAAGDVSGTCCREYILVRNNNPFRGGLDERTFQTVSQTDIQQVTSSLLPTITNNMNVSLEKLVRPHETLIKPVCTQHITSDHQVGEEATTVTITVQKSCQAGAYSTDSYSSQVINALNHQAGRGYFVSTYSPISPLQTKITDGQIIFASRYKATVVYQFSNKDQETLRNKVTGKTKQQALQLFFSQPGIQRVSISGIDTNASLPKDFTHIHILILYFPNS